MKANKSGPGKPRGTKNGYEKKARRQGDIANQKEVSLRFASEEELAFVEEAAKLAYPSAKKPRPAFLAGAALEKAEQVLQRPRPQPEPVAVPA